MAFQDTKKKNLKRNEEEISEAFSTISQPKLPSFSPQGNVTTA